MTVYSQPSLFDFHRAGARALFTRAWFARALLVAMTFAALFLVTLEFFVWTYGKLGLTEVFSFQMESWRANLRGEILPIPQGSVAGFAFETFILAVCSGIFLWGAAAFALHMLRDDSPAGRTAGAFGGFARPLGVAWLHFRVQVQTMLWAQLLIVPGVIAYYRYRAAWYLKAEHPDWSAGRCLAESGRIMRGHKFRCFALDVTYLPALIVATALPMALAFVSVALAAFVLPLFLFVLFWYVHAGRTAFYLSITERGEDTACPGLTERGEDTAPSGETNT